MARVSAGSMADESGALGTEPERVRYSTRQGEAISAVLEDVAEFRSAQDIHAELRHRGHRVGLTTVYRHLGALAERGEVDVLHTPAGETIYRRCAADAHHHHLICRFCGNTVEVEGPEIEQWMEAVARRAGFREVSHTVEIFGTCKACNSGSRSS
jgi:Fur family transcriptional regulator, ferric uptake regulator